LILTDIHELKSVLEIAENDDSENASIMLLAQQATSLIEEALGRIGADLTRLYKQERTEYLSGTGTQILLLNFRPVWTTPTPQCWVDEGGYWGQASGAFGSSPDTQLTWGTDFALRIDDGGTGLGRSGLLIRINRDWERPQVRMRGYLSPSMGPAFGNIKVTYTAGFNVDMLPAVFRLACGLVVARLRTLYPYGMLPTSESYEERSVSMSVPDRNKILEFVTEMLWNYRNLRF
jgi:hypothetical protein